MTTLTNTIAFFRRQAMLISTVTTLRSTSMTCGGRGMGAAAGAMMISSMSHHDRISSFVSTSLTPPSHSQLHPRPTGARSRAAQFLPKSPQFTSAATAFPATTRRYLSSSSNDADVSNGAATTITLPNKTGDRNGLIRHEIIADDGHPLRIYSRAPSHTNVKGDASDKLLTTGDVNTQHKKRSILLLHGRTWSSQPVFDLRTSDNDEAQQSTLQSLSDLGFHTYALDFRGFGETVRDNGGYTSPGRCVADVKCAIDWITKMHEEEEVVTTDDGDDGNTCLNSSGFEHPFSVSNKPALLGWSQGALVAQMYAQQHGPSTLSDLILFGSIFDPKVIYPRKPLYDPSGRLVSGAGSDAFKPPAPEIANTDIASLEDFTLPGTICDDAALTFSSLALQVDTIKAAWDELHEFNMCNPALIHIPTMVIVGAQDPYVSWEAQRELFERLGTEDRAMCVLPGCDHAAHILKARKMFVRGVAGFLLRKDVF